MGTCTTPSHTHTHTHTHTRGVTFKAQPPSPPSCSQLPLAWAWSIVHAPGGSGELTHAQKHRQLYAEKTGRGPPQTGTVGTEDTPGCPYGWGGATLPSPLSSRFWAALLAWEVGPGDQQPFVVPVSLRLGASFPTILIYQQGCRLELPSPRSDLNKLCVTWK